MAEVDIRIGGRKYELACREGDQERLRGLADMVDQKASEAARGMGGLNEVRQLLFAALLLADELSEARARPAPPPEQSSADDDAATVVEWLAERVEALAASLEKTGVDA
jgi:cell division protein ZapA